MKILVHAAVIIGTLFGSDMKLNHGEQTRALLHMQGHKQLFSYLHRKVVRFSTNNDRYVRKILD